MSCKLSDLVRFNPPRNVKKGEARPYIDMASIQEHKRDIKQVINRSFDGGGSKFRNGDTLLARLTPCLENGKSALVSGLESDGWGSTEFIVMSPKQESDADFIYYITRFPEFREYAIRNMSGTSGRQRVSWQIIAEFDFNFPEKEYRKKAGKLLRGFDDIIRNNLMLNEKLEIVASKLFKSWFIDFDPVHAKKNALETGLTKAQAERATMAVIAGLCSPTEYAENTKEIEKKIEERLASIGKEKSEDLKATASLFPSEFEDSELGPIPKGWGINTLSDVIQFNPTLSLKKNTIAKYVDMKSVPNSGHRINEVVSRPFGSGTKFQNGDVLMARITPCLENGKTAYVDCLDSDEVAWGSTEFIVMRPKSFIPDKWIYLLSRHPEFVAFAVTNMSGTSGRQRVSADVLGSFKLRLPQDDLVFNEIKKILEPIFEKIKVNSLENANLAQLRDLLLPKLLSAEIDLREVSID